MDASPTDNLLEPTDSPSPGDNTSAEDQETSSASAPDDSEETSADPSTSSDSDTEVTRETTPEPTPDPPTMSSEQEEYSTTRTFIRTIVNSDVDDPTPTTEVVTLTTTRRGSNDDSNSGNSGSNGGSDGNVLSPGQIAGIVIGAIVLLGAILLVWACLKRRRRPVRPEHFPKRPEPSPWGQPSPWGASPDTSWTASQLERPQPTWAPHTSYQQTAYMPPRQHSGQSSGEVPTSLRPGASQKERKSDKPKKRKTHQHQNSEQQTQNVMQQVGLAYKPKRRGRKDGTESGSAYGEAIPFGPVLGRD